MLPHGDRLRQTTPRIRVPHCGSMCRWYGSSLPDGTSTRFDSGRDGGELPSRGYGCAMSNSGTAAVQSVQSVDRAVTILEILSRDGEAGVTDVARELGVHKSTASRLLAALDRRELVTQDAARGRFRLGV